MEKKILILLILIIIPTISASCTDIYYFIINTNYNFNEIDLINNNITLEMIESYPELCEIYGYPPLPNKPNLPVITINKTEECNLETKPFFRKDIPFLHIGLGDVSCRRIDFWKHIFTIEQNINYEIKGIKLWLVAGIIILIGLALFFKSNSWLNRMLRRYEKP